MYPKPLVSVLMTAYNSEKFIEEAIESVLASNYSNFELLIVDDYSIDNTLSIASKYALKDDRIRIYTNDKNLGDYPNRNKAASYAKGKYIKYLDSDDIMYPHCLDVMVRSMEMFPDAGIGLSSMPDPNKPYPVLLNPREAYLENFNGYGHFLRAPGSGIINLEAFNKVGGFSGERMIGDADLWYKMAMYYPIVKMSTFLYWDRQHESQERQSSYAKQYPKLQKMILERYFNHADCPLSEKEKKEILRNKRKQKIKGFILSKLKKIV